MSERRQFPLLPQDQAFLDAHGLPWEAIIDGSHWILLHDFQTHVGYNHASVTAGIRLAEGYPLGELDMVYVYPALARVDGKSIAATQAIQQIEGKSYQRWSRHRTPQNPWKPGADNIGTHVYLIEDWFAREFEK